LPRTLSKENPVTYTILFTREAGRSKVDGKGNVCEAKMARGGRKKKAAKKTTKRKSTTKRKTVKRRR